MLKFKIAAFAILSVCLFVACNGGDDQNRRPVPDVSDIKIDLKIGRFDQDLWAIDTSKLTEAVAFLEKKYPVFTPVLLNQILLDPRNPKESSESRLAALLHSPGFQTLRDSIQLVYGDFKTEQKGLTRLFQFHQYYFPERPIPEILTVFTGYGYGAFPVSDSLFCLGLEFFLGQNHPNYRLLLDLPEFVRVRMNKKYAVSQVAEAIALDHVGAPGGSRLLDEMVANGKAWYLKDCLLPEAPDSIKWGFSQQQIDWCRENELEIWSYILQEKLLYATDRKKFRKLVEESPNAGDSPPALRDAPGRVANWLGFRIVCSFMKRHPQLDLRGLLLEKDSQKLLEAARYKPRK